MPVYTVHEPSRHGSDDDTIAHTSRFVFVRDGFHFWAFLLTPLWLLRHRLWLEFIAWLVIVAGVTFALRLLGIDVMAGGWVGLLIAILVGIEASSLRRWKLARRKFEQVGVVVADDLEMAERRFFDGWMAHGERPTPAFPPSAPPPSPFAPPAATEIIGLFPQPQARP